MHISGGYDDGYAACDCFWGSEPGSLVKALVRHVPEFNGLHVLDAGCGEGKNAVYLSSMGAKVFAIDISSLAIKNALAKWGTPPNVSWRVADVSQCQFSPKSYDLVIAYGILHCLHCPAEVLRIVSILQAATREGGLHVLCAFNSREQDLAAHPGFSPCLLAHGDYLKMYSDWEVLTSTDTNLTETHPHNCVEHTHSMTRLIAKRPVDVTSS
jgi:tellurite methyltransferase